MSDKRTTETWSGDYRGSHGIPPHLSPLDRPPHRQVVALDAMPDLLSGDAPLPLTFREWCGWVFIEDDGGSGLIVNADGQDIPVKSGRTVWIGKSRCTIGRNGESGAPVSIVGCTAADAQTLAQGALSVALSAQDSNPNKTVVNVFTFDGNADQPFTPDPRTVYSIVTYNIDNGAAFSVSDSDTSGERVVIDDGSHVSDAQANAQFNGKSDILFHGTSGDSAVILQYVKA